MANLPHTFIKKFIKNHISYIINNTFSDDSALDKFPLISTADNPKNHNPTRQKYTNICGFLSL